ncbi:MAG TPA: tetratricopeptide repeat protein [Thermoanaerobaculia bacterium]|nr:tetratricopeptide repeat protein [Thermoanaerobaculia bacterium]
MMRNALLLLLLIATACTPAGPPTTPNDREWSLLTADYQWLETVRKAQKQPAPNASRKERIETLLENHKKLEPTYVAFIDKVRAYYERTADPRAGALLAREKIILGDEYMTVLSRYDRAIELYREALELQPGSTDAQERIALAEKKRFVSMTDFANVKTGMKEDAVQRLVGLPREDWIKQVTQNNRVYSVWIYPKADGGASAIYFDNGVVYHTNWNAAAPPAAKQ